MKIFNLIALFSLLNLNLLGQNRLFSSWSLREYYEIDKGQSKIVSTNKDSACYPTLIMRINKNRKVDFLFNNRLLFNGKIRVQGDSGIKIINKISERLYDTETKCNVETVFRSIIKQELNKVTKYYFEGNNLVLIFTVPTNGQQERLVFESIEFQR